MPHLLSKTRNNFIYPIAALFLITTCFMFLPQCSKKTTIKQLNEGSTPPDFALATLNNRSIRLSSLHGKVVLLNFWASWCPPCMEELPSLQALYSKLKNKEFAIVGVNIEEDGQQTVPPIVQKLGIEFTLLLDPEQKTTKLYSLTGVPETYLINKNGTITKKFIGPRNWTDPDIVTQIESLLK